MAWTHSPAGTAGSKSATTGDRHATQWIGGDRVTSPQIGTSVNPATGAILGTYADADVTQMQAAIDIAEEVLRTSSWRSDAMTRAAALSHLADAYAGHFDEVIETLCSENGKLRGEAGYEVSAVPKALRFAAGLAVQSFGRVIESRPGQQSIAIREPVGVAGIIAPWNSPVYLMIRALAPALAAGCTTVVKLPAQAAQSATLAAQIIASVPEIPRGAVNIIVESGDVGARLLVDSPQVAMVSFTGSTQTGRAIARAAADRLKRVGLELGGKTPHVVFDDANLAPLLPTLEKSLTVFAGQFCMTGSRVLVQRGIAEKVISGLAARLTAVKPGPADDPDSDMGPLISKAEVERVDDAVKHAIDAGAEIIVRGGPVTEGDLAAGAFYRPTLLKVNDQTLPIVQQETFGPVQTIQVFDTEDEAIDLANATEYGLSASVWSQDAATTMRVARRIDAGLISVNSWANLAVQLEEGGFKASGLGRLGGVASLDDFLEYKQITQEFA